MELRVDDFGCVPEGRVLERVAIAAGSTVLASPGGGRERDKPWEASFKRGALPGGCWQSGSRQHSLWINIVASNIARRY